MSNPEKIEILEQIIDDPVSGLQIQFEKIPDGTSRVRLFGGGLEFGNREFVIENGKMTGAGTSLAGHCKPTWLTQID